jgi:hypothetical protein
VMPLADDLAPREDNRADERIRKGLTERILGELERTADTFLLEIHIALL